MTQKPTLSQLSGLLFGACDVIACDLSDIAIHNPPRTWSTPAASIASVTMAQERATGRGLTYEEFSSFSQETRSAVEMLLGAR